MVKVGVVGFSAQKFDKELANSLLETMFSEIERMYQGEKFSCVTGLTDLGIPALAYRCATGKRWETVGIACKKAMEYNCYSVDEAIIVGSEWGDESDEFIKYIDVLIRVGGGNQSKKEEQMARKKGIPVFVFDIPAEK